MFKCQPGYTLRKIKGISYLLPYGQQIADLKKGFVLNETSTFLWNVLQHHEGAEPQQLAEILARTYQLDESYYPELLKDVTDFLTQLTAMGMITEDLHLISSIPSVSMIIAGICIKLYGSAELIYPNFNRFYHFRRTCTPDLKRQRAEVGSFTETVCFLTTCKTKHLTL